jgi:prepilin-type N-terminal cleavage/methylation domain-containing protein
MRANKGFTLIEIAVVLAIIAILAAILTPIVTSYIDQARVTRANADTKKIAEAVLLYKRDTSVFPGYANWSNAVAADTTVLSCLTSDGTTPTLIAPNTGFCTSTGSLFQYLNVNTMQGSIFTSNATGEAIGGGIKFRAPYLDGLGGQDPWGTPYLVTSKNFAKTVGAGGPNYGFVVSAGPNTAFDTNFSQARAANNTGVSFAVGSDDVAALIN